MKLYMEVSKDEYELPVAVAETAVELARLRKVSRYSIFRGIWAEKHGEYKSIYKCVEVDDEGLE